MKSGVEPSDEASSAPALTASNLRWFFLVVLLAGFALRFYGISLPPYDAHSFRQTQTLSTIENYHAEGIDLLHPKTIYMGYPGTFVLEVPLFQAAAALLYRVFGDHLELVRLLNILIGAGAMWMVFRIGDFYLGRSAGMVAAMIYWLAPLNIVYQRSMLIDPTAVFFGLVCFYRLALLLRSVEPDAYPKSDRNGNDFLVFAVAAFLTALIKALYLWPAVLLLGQYWWTKRFRFDRRMVQVIAVFALAGISFLMWNAYATRVNDLSPFTRGVKPTSLLGFSVLLTSDFYNELLLHRPKRWLGALGILFYLFGLVALRKEKWTRPGLSSVFLIFVIPPTYLLAFANINRPHDYYQLIITPFLALASAYGLVQAVSYCARKPVPMPRVFASAGVIVFILASVFTYVVWMRAPNLDAEVLKFEKLCAGKFEPRRPGMVFVSRAISSRNPNSYVPEYVYAANLWGFGRVVEDAAGARAEFEELGPAFSELDFVVFYGTEFPSWFPLTSFSIYLRDDQARLYAFRRTTGR